MSSLVALEDEIYSRLLAEAEQRIADGVSAELVLWETQHLAEHYQYYGNPMHMLAAERLCRKLGARVDAKD